MRSLLLAALLGLFCSPAFSAGMVTGIKGDKGDTGPAGGGGGGGSVSGQPGGVAYFASTGSVVSSGTFTFDAVNNNILITATDSSITGTGNSILGCSSCNINNSMNSAIIAASVADMPHAGATSNQLIIGGANVSLGGIGSSTLINSVNMTEIDAGSGNNTVVGALNSTIQRTGNLMLNGNVNHIGDGTNSTDQPQYCSIINGQNNTIHGVNNTGSTILGGSGGLIQDGSGSVLLGGSGLTLNSNFSIAGGVGATCSGFNNAFVWADEFGGLSCDANDEWMIQARNKFQVSSTARVWVNGEDYYVNTSVPTPSACGSGPTMNTGSNDSNGKVTTGTGVFSSCTITFGNAYTMNDVECQCNDETSLKTLRCAGSNTTFVITAAVINPGDVISYHCNGF